MPRRTCRTTRSLTLLPPPAPSIETDPSDLDLGPDDIGPLPLWLRNDDAEVWAAVDVLTDGRWGLEAETWANALCLALACDDRAESLAATSGWWRGAAEVAAHLAGALPAPVFADMEREERDRLLLAVGAGLPDPLRVVLRNLAHRLATPLLDPSPTPDLRALATATHSAWRLIAAQLRLTSLLDDLPRLLAVVRERP